MALVPSLVCIYICTSHRNSTWKYRKSNGVYILAHDKTQETLHIKRVMSKLEETVDQKFVIRSQNGTNGCSSALEWS